MLIGGAVLGAGVQGFITEWLNSRNNASLVIYALLTLVGMLIAALGTR